MKNGKWWIPAIVLLALVIVAVWGTEAYLKKRIRNELQVQTTYGDTLQISKVDLGLLGGWIDINDLVIRYNIGRQENPDQRLTYLIRGHIGKIQLKGLSFLQFVFQNRISINELIIDSSAFDLYLLDTSALERPAVDSLQDNSMAITISGIRIAPSRVRYFEMTDSLPIFEAAALSLNLEGFRYPLPDETPSVVDHFDWAVKKMRIGRPEQFSDLFIGEASGHSGDSLFSFSNLWFKPRYSKAEYSRWLRQEDSRLEIFAGTGQMEGVDWLRLLTEEYLSARNLTVDSCIIEVYEDSSLPIRENRYKSLYQEKLLRSEVGISVDSVSVRGGVLNYTVRPKLPGAALGYLEFREMEAGLSNITNDPSAIEKNPLLQARVNARLNGESHLATFFTFDLSAPDYSFSFAGEMDAFHLPKFNSILREPARMAFKNGEIHRMSFDVQADNKVARGEFRIEFSDLEIDWLEEHNVLAALAQKVLMLEENPKNGKFRVGQVYFERLTNRSFWNFYVKSLLSGLNSTVFPNLLLPEELDSKKERVK